jgi:asparagine synthase (glutamine-hydrolysing)
MIPPPSENDPPEVHERYAIIASGQSKGLGDDEYYGYQQDLRQSVERAFAAHGIPVDGERVALHEGLFEDTLEPSGPVALAHIDSDWYDPVTLCLTRLWPVLSSHGRIVIDDYNDYAGCKQAVHEFLAANRDAELLQVKPNAVLSKAASA